MTVEYGGKEYTLSFDNWGLHQYAEACGLETLEEAFLTFQGFAEVASGGGLTIAQSKQLGYLCREVIGESMDLKEAINLIYEHPGLIGDCLSVALQALPKPRPDEDNGEKKKVMD